MKNYSKQGSIFCLVLLTVLTGCTSLSNTGRMKDDSWVKVELFFGAEIPGTEREVISEPYGVIDDVSDEEWKSFMTYEILPRFKNGFTILEGMGGWEREGELILEKSRILIVVFDSQSMEESLQFIDDIIKAYTTQFDQDAVMRIMSETKVDFLN